MKREILINSSSFRYAICDRAYKLFMLDELQSTAETKTFKMAYGTAVHQFIADVACGKPVGESANRAIEYYTPFEKQLGDKDFHTVTHLGNTLLKYSINYHNDSLAPVKVGLDYLIEQKFKLPFYEDSNNIVYLYGTVDMVAKWMGQACIVDHKVTSNFKQDEFLSKYEFNIQPMLYSYALGKLTGSPHLPVMINGIFISKGTQVCGYTDGVKFKRSNLIEYSDGQMTELVAYLKAFCKKVAEMAYEPLPNYSACHAGFSPCPYLPYCAAKPEHKQIMLATKFTKRDTNPFKFIE